MKKLYVFREGKQDGPYDPSEVLSSVWNPPDNSIQVNDDPTSHKRRVGGSIPLTATN